ncbi:ATP-binding protein [Micromonosporaceae bacterium Da 78-11]
MALVIVVEDNVDHQRMMIEVVRRLGHDVSAASDGRLGLDLVTAQRPDLVLADVDLPHLSGLQLCEAMRDHLELTGIPVVLVTGFLPPTDPRVGGCGARAVLRKPFSVQELTDIVQSHLAAPAAHPVPAAAGRDVDTHQSTGMVRAHAAKDPAFVDALLDSLDIGVVACDTSGRLVLLNRALEQFFGDDSAAVPLQQWPQRFTLRHHDGTPLTAEELPLSRALTGEQVHQGEMLADDRSGHPAWFSINARPIYDRDGVMLGAVAAVHDVTTEHQAQQYQNCKNAVLQVLAEVPNTDTAAQQVLHAIATTLRWPHMRLWLRDPVTDRLRPAAIYTAPAEKPLPVPHSITRGEGLAGRCWQRGELLWIPDITAPDSPLLPSVAHDSSYQAAGAVPVRSGNTTTGVMTFFSHRRQEPEPSLSMLLTGVTGHLGAYLEHRRANDLATQLAASVQEYISLVGHELRTPLTSIGAYTELITTSPDTTPIGEVRDLLDVVMRNSDRLRDLVEKLLDLAGLETGAAELHHSSINLTTLITDAITAINPLAEQRHIRIHTRLSAQAILTGDAHRLRQVIDHLLDNAVRYSPEHADVTVVMHNADDDAAAVVTITDTGPGIPAEDQPQLFRRLYRGSNARHTGIPGAGLGLALSRAIIGLHHGTITLTPAHPHGTTATLRLRLAEPTHHDT